MPPEDEIARLRAENERLKQSLKEVERQAAYGGELRCDMAQAHQHFTNIARTVRDADQAGSTIPPTLHTHTNPKREDR